MLAFILAPGLGVLIYFLFGRDGKAFSKQSKLLLSPPMPSPCSRRSCPGSMQRSPGSGSESVSRRRLLRLVRRNSLSVLTRRNRVEIQQNAAEFYSSLIKDMEGARRSIHHQYFIWGADG